MHQRVPRDDEQPAVGISLGGHGIFLDDEHRVLPRFRHHLRDGGVIAETAQNVRVLKGKDVERPALHALPPDAEDVLGAHHLGVHDGGLRVQLRERDVLREDLEWRADGDLHLPLAEFPVRVERHALCGVPAHLIKGAARHLAPHVRLAHERAEPVLGGDRLHEFGGDLSRCAVGVVGGRGAHRRLRLHPRELGEPRLEDGRDVVVHLPALPEILPAVLLHVPARRDLRKLVADDKVHVQPPIQFDGAAGFLPFAEVLQHRRDDVLFNFRHFSLLFASPCGAPPQTRVSPLRRVP